MPGEFNSMLDELVRFADNYGENAKKIVVTPDQARLVSIYQQALVHSCSALRDALRQGYETVGEDEQRQADQYCIMTGGLTLLEAANQFIGPNSTDEPSILSEAGEIFHKIKTIASDIPWVLKLAIPFVGGIAALLKTIDLFADNIRKLIDKIFGDGDGKPAPKPPAPNKDPYNVVELEVCKRKVLWDRQEQAELEITSYEQDDEIDVYIDDNPDPDPRPLHPHPQRYKGHKITVHLRHTTRPNSKAEIGWRKIG
jgi:hypothetical protein